MKRIAILGAGTAGTMMANKLARRLSSDEWEIVVIDRDNTHVYQPGLLFLPFQMYRTEELLRKRHTLLPDGVELLLAPVDKIDPDAQIIAFRNGEKLHYDILIVATGTRINPELTEGLTGPGWHENMFDFYTLDGAEALAKRMERFEGGRLVVNVVDMPIKCPVAPLEFLFLADAYFTEQGIRDKVEIVYATPLASAFTKPRASAALGGLMESRNIIVEPNFTVEKADGESGVLTSYDGRETDFDLLVTVPLHNGSKLISDSEMGDDFGFLETDKHTLQSTRWKNVWGIGDGTNLPTSKAGSVAHFQAEVLLPNIVRHTHGLEPLPDFDGHANCFIETGFGKGMLIDFNYETEPLPGRFPLPGIGPFRLLEESPVNHWGKLAFKWVYWNLLVKGEELPLQHQMLMAGKWS